MIFVTDIRKKHDQKRHGVIILFFNLPIDKVYRKITPQSGVAAKPQKKPFNTNIVKTKGFDSRRFGGIDLWTLSISRLNISITKHHAGSSEKAPAIVGRHIGGH